MKQPVREAYSPEKSNLGKMRTMQEHILPKDNAQFKRLYIWQYQNCGYGKHFKRLFF